ncbi:MAG: glycosyltransferase family 1 protein [Massilibacteroides sp.]|nr:glycosyltransferase family 1 protein [Massilibacteroides sp.]
MEKIKVVFFADILISDFDGASRTMFHLINRIPVNQFEFLFVCGLGPKQINHFKCIHVFTLGVPGNKSYRFAAPMLQQLELDKIVESFAPHVIHISTPSLLGNYALKTAKRLGLPVITIYHTHFISYVDYYIRNFPFLIDLAKNKVNDALKSFYNQCDTVYVPSQCMIQELGERGVRQDVMKLWERGIDKNLFSPTKRNPEIIRSLTGNDYPCILFVSRLVWEKNLQMLIDLYHLIKKRKLNYNLLVVGEGVARKEIEKQMPEALFLGHRGHTELASLYASSTVFFFPSVTETFGNVVLEAMASGIPCVVADKGGSRDFVDDGVNGFRCNPYNVEAFLEKIMLIIEQPKLARQFSEKGLEQSRKYVWENLASIYFNDLKLLSYDLQVV